MLETIQSLLGIAAMLSLVAIIKPTLFHKKLTRRYAFLGMIVVILLIAVTPKDPNAEIERQAEAQARQEVADAKAAKEKAIAEEEAAQQAAINALFEAITLSAELQDDSIGTPNLYVDLTNGTDLTIDALTLTAVFENNFGDHIGEWNTTYGDDFSGISNETIYPGTTKYNMRWNLATFDQATKITSITVNRVHFTDGTEINR
jgi:hypothetical protein